MTKIRLTSVAPHCCIVKSLCIRFDSAPGANHFNKINQSSEITDHSTADNSSSINDAYLNTKYIDNNILSKFKNLLL